MKYKSVSSTNYFLKLLIIFKINVIVVFRALFKTNYVSISFLHLKRENKYAKEAGR